MEKELREIMRNSLSVDIFQGEDIDFAKQLAKVKQWNKHQVNAVHSVLNKYEKDLVEIGVEMEELKPIVNPTKEWKATLLENNTILLSFYSKDNKLFWETVAEIKKIPQREWHQATKSWRVPITILNVKTIKKLGFTMSSEINEWFEEHKDDFDKSVKFIKSNADKLAKKIRIPEMFPFQREGLSFLEYMGGRALISDEMGLGKTLQALAYLKLHPELRPAVIIVPATLKLNWRKETLKWIGEESYIINGKKDEGYYNEDIIIINYDIMEAHQKQLTKLNPQIVIGDEIHKIKNQQAKRTKAVKKLCKKVPHIIGLSGTPILNRPVEIFSILNILKPEIFPNYWRFGERYGDPQNNGFGTVYNGSSNLEELHELLREHAMIRRLKKNVLTELPDKQKSVITFSIDNRKEYKEAEEDVIQYIHNLDGREAAIRASRAETLARFNKLKQLAAQGKMKCAIKWIEDFLESEEKLVLFAVHKKVITQIMEHFGDIAVKIDGSVSSVKRQKAVDDFQNDPKIKLFVGNIIAASEGITLTASSNVAFLELGWVPGLHSQAADRVHRIGQANACTIYYLLSEDTIEEDIAEMIDRKQKVVSAVLDGGEPDEGTLFQDLWNTLSEK